MQRAELALQPAAALALPERSVALVLSGTEHEKLRWGVWLIGAGLFVAGIVVGRLTKRGARGLAPPRARRRA